MMVTLHPKCVQLPNSSSNGDAKLSPKSSDNKSGDSTYQCHHHGCRDEECDASESRGASSSGVPDWVHSLINSTFYEPCTHGHEGYKKNECTFFCTTCSPKGMGGLCQHCMDCHANEGHQTIQIRRYVYCDVVRAVDISSHLDISGVQVYIVNQANVVFLNHRPQSKPARSSSHDSCQTCARQLREGCSFCSLACKVEAMCKSEGCVQPKPAPKPKIAEAPQQRSPKSATDPQVPSKRRRSNPSTEYQYQSSRAYQAQPERSYANIHANVSSGDEGASGVWNHSLPGSPYNQLDCNHEAMLAVATLSLPGLTHSTLDYSTEAMHAAALLGNCFSNCAATSQGLMASGTSQGLTGAPYASSFVNSLTSQDLVGSPNTSGFSNLAGPALGSLSDYIQMNLMSVNHSFLPLFKSQPDTAPATAASGSDSEDLPTPQAAPLPRLVHTSSQHVSDSSSMRPEKRRRKGCPRPSL